MAMVRRSRVVILLTILTIIALYYLNAGGISAATPYRRPGPSRRISSYGNKTWSKLPDHFPVTSIIPLPTGTPREIPKIQAEPPTESAEAKEERLQRLKAVKESFAHSWKGYCDHAWLRDEVTPVTASWKDTFGGWAASLVDSLDTLWIFGMKEDFEVAVSALSAIQFSTTESKTINVFETTIRYLGGFLGAYDISGGQYPVLLEKATEIGELLMSAFDTENRLPISRFEWMEYMTGKPQQAPSRMIVSELGSLSLEFTRLTQLTGDPKYYDAIQRISDVFEEYQNLTKLPGMWPVSVDAATPSFEKDTLFTLGGMSDSLYEYFPKQYLLLGGLLSQPRKLYEIFIQVAKEFIFFPIYNPQNLDLLISGDIRTRGPENRMELQPRGQHLGCFAGGMVGIAAKIFERPQDLAIAEQLTNGCVWAYDSFPHGVSPEIFYAMPCPSDGDCTWSEDAWLTALKRAYIQEPTMSDEMQIQRVQKIIRDHHLPLGFTHIQDARYILRPEAIESVYYMYRITGSKYWADVAWRMFQAVEEISRTPVAASAIWDVMEQNPRRIDSMESFWLAETLKYFYLCFEEFDVVSLDEWVLNTEAHPLRRPTVSMMG